MKALAGLFTVLLILCSPLYAQLSSVGGYYPSLALNSYTYFGGSARSMAMGYAFVGLANDVSSGSWNPAGIWTLESPIVAGSYNTYVPKGTFTQSLTPGVTNNSLDLNGVGQFSFVAPVRIKGHPFVFNFNFDRTNEYTTEASYRANVTNADITYYQNDVGHLSIFNFGGSTRIYRQLSFGVLLNIFDGRRATEATRTFAAELITDPVYGTTQDFVNTVSIVDSVTSSGFNFTSGLMWKSEKFSLGAVVRTPFTLKHSDDYDSSGITSLDGLPQIESSDTVYTPDIISKQDMPLTIAAGIGLFPTEKLTVTLDINYQNYGSTNYYHQDSSMFDAGGVRTDFFTEVPIDWNNTFGIGGGAEYVLDFGFGRIPVRAGLRYDQLPQPKYFWFTGNNVGYDESGAFQLSNYQVIATAMGRQNEVSFSLGSGIAWSQIAFDFAYRFTTGQKLVQTSTTYAYDENSPGNVYFASTTNIVERKSNEFRVTVTGHF
jgi:hypothetical protein